MPENPVEKPYALVIDDNEATCTLIAALLRHDFELEMAGDGFEAIEKLRTGNYAVILLDLRMPQMDGFAVLDFIRQHNAASLRRVLVLTAALTSAEMARVGQYEICAVVAKPFEVETLLSAVKKCVGPDTASTARLFSSGMFLLLAEVLRQKLL